MAEEINGQVEGQETAPPKKKSKLTLILIILVVIIAAGAGGGYYFFGAKIFKKAGAEQQEGEPKRKGGIGPILALEPFVFNLSGSPSKFAKITLGIELKDPKILEEGKKMMPAIRDQVLSVLGSKGPEALMDVAARDTIKKEIHGKLKGLFKDGADLNAVYITDIIVQ